MSIYTIPIPESEISSGCCEGAVLINNFFELLPRVLGSISGAEFDDVEAIGNSLELQLNAVEVFKNGTKEKVGNVLSHELCVSNNAGDDTLSSVLLRFHCRGFIHMKTCLLAVLFIFTINIRASEISYIVRSPKALLMGDAFTAAPDDEFAMYYNPAALGNGNLIEFSSINPTFSLSNLLSDADKFSDLSSDPGTIATTIMNTPLYIQTMGAPALKVRLGWIWAAS